MDVLMFIIKWILMIPFMWGLLFISIFFHEMGHLIMYLIFYRENNWRIEIGSKGKKSLEIGRFTIYPKMLTGHIYYNFKKYNKLNSIMVSAGGPLVNLILIIFIIIRKVLKISLRLLLNLDRISRACKRIKFMRARADFDCCICGANLILYQF